MTADQASTSSLATEPPAVSGQDLERGQALLVITPQAGTAAGIAEYAISRARRRGRSAFYASPNEALALRRYRQWQAALGPVEVGLLTKAVRHRPQAPLVVGTPATLRSMLFTEPDRLRDAGYVVFDDIDLLSDTEQETAWEELMIQLPSAVPLLCFSAPMGNAEELAAWLTQVRGSTRLRRHEERAVPLQHLYLWDNRLHPLVGTDSGVAAEVAAGRRRGAAAALEWPAICHPAAGDSQRGRHAPGAAPGGTPAGALLRLGSAELRATGCGVPPGGAARLSLAATQTPGTGHVLPPHATRGGSGATPSRTTDRAYRARRGRVSRRVAAGIAASRRGAAGRRPARYCLCYRRPGK